MLPLRYIRNIETLIAQRNWPAAYERLGRLLGGFSGEESTLTEWATGATSSDARHVFSRLASCITTVFLEPTAELNKADYVRFSTVMPEIAHVFVVSGYTHTGAILEGLLARGSTNSGSGTSFASQSDARKFLLCSSIYGNVEPLLSLLEHAAQQTLGPVLGALSAHVTCDPLAQNNRNRLLDALAHTETAVPTERSMFDIHRAWTLCSYATTEHRHETKRYLNRLIKNWLEARQIPIPDVPQELQPSERPRLLVACEVAGGGHVMSRCYEPFLEQLRDRFHVVLLVAEHDLGDDHVPWCDELIRFNWDLEHFGEVLANIANLKPDVIYYPCIGMRLWSIITCNVRLAPLQIASLGHPATTHSPAIDYMVGGNTTTGADECFSEQVVRFKSPGNLYRLNRPQECFPREIKTGANPIRVATCANMLKLNADFLGACRRIAEQATRPVEFHFMPNCIGLKLCVARQQIASVLDGHARYRVFPREACSNYLQHLRECDVYLSPFPFGGENSMLDALLQGMPGVTLCAQEPHTRLDARVMETAQLPKWLITHSVEEYTAAATRLIDEEETRLDLMRKLVETDLEQEFEKEHDVYAGDFVDTMWGIIEKESGESRQEA